MQALYISNQHMYQSRNNPTELAKSENYVESNRTETAPVNKLKVHITESRLLLETVYN